MRVLLGKPVGVFILVVMAALLVANSCGRDIPEEALESSPQTAESSGNDLATKSTAQAEPTVESPIGELTYDVLNEEIYDVPIKTQVVLEILVSGAITAEFLETLLTALYDEIISRTGFQYHPNPTNVYIYAYTSRERAASGMGQWIAMMQKSYNDVVPEFSIKEAQMGHLGTEPESRLGFTEEERIGIFQEYVRAEDRAMTEAMQKYPDLLPRQPGYSQDAFMEQLNKQIEEQDRLTEVYKDQVAAKYRLTREQLGEIVSEGLGKDWPFPPLSG